MRFLLHMFILWFACQGFSEETVSLTPYTLIAEQRNTGGQVAFTTFPSMNPYISGVAEMLEEPPTFALYRREGAQQANPTAQGVSLGNIGVTATSRTLVLRNGIPQNDPFGGWIPWTRFAPQSIQSAKLLSPGSALSWGSGSPGGVLLLEDLSPFEAQDRFDLTAGHPGEFSGYLRQSITLEDVAISAEVVGADREGFKRVHPEDRGPVDERVDLTTFSARLVAELERENGRWLFEGSGTNEQRGNGLPQAENSTEAWDLSIQRQIETPNWTLTTLVYGQTREFENTFAATNADRTTSRIVLDQFSVPSRSAGGSITLAGAIDDRTELFGGVDTRWIKGETNERFFNDGTMLRRQREAGGDQIVSGAFTGIRWDQGIYDIEASSRVDLWEFTDGRLIIEDLTGGGAGSREDFSDRDGLEPSAQISVGMNPTDTWRVEVGGSQSFRLPTLNELYRPFRIGRDTTLANPELEPEEFQTIRASVRNSSDDGKIRFHAAVLHHWISDAIANVTLDPDPSGALAQRINVPEAEVLGVEGSVEVVLSEALDLTLRYGYSRSTFESTVGEVDLVGNTFPLAPEHVVTGHLHYANEPWGAELRGRYESSSFDDTNNTRKLPDAFTLDTGITLQLRPDTLLYLRGENLLDETIVSAEQANGTRFIAPGRSVSLGVSIRM